MNNVYHQVYNVYSGEFRCGNPAMGIGTHFVPSDKVYIKRDIDSNLSNNEVYCTNPLILLVKNMV